MKYYKRFYTEDKWTEVSKEHALDTLLTTYKDNSFTYEMLDQVWTIPCKFSEIRVVDEKNDAAENGEYQLGVRCIGKKEAGDDYIGVSVGDMVIQPVVYNADILKCSIVDRNILEKIGISEKDLVKRAMANMRHMFPMVRIPLSMFGDAEEDFGKSYFAITNSKSMYGFVTVFYPGMVKKIADEIGDYYIVPSSKHEAIIVQAAKVEANEMLEILHEINKAVVAGEDLLPEDIYMVTAGTYSVQSYLTGKELEFDLLGEPEAA